MEDDYPCVVDGAPASIGVNLRFEHAPPASHDTRYTLAILMREGGDQGLGTAAEVAALDLVEEALMPRAFALGLTYVGRLRTRGVWEVTFYGPRNHLTTLRAHATELAGDRQIAILVLHHSQKAKTSPGAVGWQSLEQSICPGESRCQ